MGTNKRKLHTSKVTSGGGCQQAVVLSGHCLCFGSSYHPEEQKAKVRPSHPEKGSMIDSDIVPFTKGRIWERCLEDTSTEFSSKKYRSYLTR